MRVQLTLLAAIAITFMTVGARAMSAAALHGVSRPPAR